MSLSTSRLESLKHNGEIEWQKRLDDMRGRNETLTGSHESLAVDRNIERKVRCGNKRKHVVYVFVTQEKASVSAPEQPERENFYHSVPRG